MLTLKKCVYHITVISLFTIPLSLQYLWAKEPLKNPPSEQQKADKKQLQTPALNIKGAKIEIVPNNKASEKQKTEDQQTLGTSGNQPHITIDPSYYDAGEVWEGNAVVHAFTVKNTGTAQLTIEQVKPG